MIVQADVHRPVGEHDEGMKSPPSGRNSTESVPFTSLCLAAGRGAAAVGGGPAGFTLAPFPPIVNATVAAAT